MRAMLLIWAGFSLIALITTAPLLWRMRRELTENPTRYLFASVAGQFVFSLAVLFVAVRVLIRTEPDAPPSLNVVALTIGYLITAAPNVLFAGYMLGVFAGGKQDEATQDRL